MPNPLLLRRKKKMVQQEQPNPQPNPLFLLDALYCEEERLEEDAREEDLNGEGDGDSDNNINNHGTKRLLLHLLLLEQDLFWEDEELVSLFAKEEETHLDYYGLLETDASLAAARREAVVWLLRVNAHYGFSALTSVLAINYLDRFLSSLCFQNDKPWMAQLAAVACLSLAAKVEETQVPLLLDLQVEETRYVFEAKTIQRMELLVLSTLRWRMNPVTPVSFLDHIIRRLGLKTHLHWKFLHSCERLLISVIADMRSVRYLPSVMATATMLHVINEIDPCNAVEYQDQLLGVLKISRDKVDDCYQLILEVSGGHDHDQEHSRKRKCHSIPESPNGIIDASFSYESSIGSFAVALSASSSPEPVFKKNRTHDQQEMRLSTFNRAFVEVMSSPR